MQRRGHGCSAEGTRDGRTTSQRIRTFVATALSNVCRDGVIATALSNVRRIRRTELKIALSEGKFRIETPKGVLNARNKSNSTRTNAFSTFRHSTILFFFVKKQNR